MKKFIFIAALLAIFQRWDDIDRFINPPPDFALDHGGEVVLYATKRCGYCKKARELMSKHNIKYYEYDIDNSSEGRAQYDSLGGKGVPVLLIGGEVVHGYNPSKILELANQT